jgi:hypothetical protein
VNPAAASRGSRTPIRGSGVQVGEFDLKRTIAFLDRPHGL